jgi:RimJ/RimL family protein N-acetyltransferase
VFGPVLKGLQRTLRAPNETDAARFVAWFADLEVTHYLAERFPVSLQQEEEFFRRTGESKSEVWWVIEAEGKAIGASGIHRIDWINAHATTGTVIGTRVAGEKATGQSR